MLEKTTTDAFATAQAEIQIVSEIIQAMAAAQISGVISLEGTNIDYLVKRIDAALDQMETAIRVAS